MEERNLRKEMVGVVSSDKMDKTVVVSVQWTKNIKLMVKFKRKHTN